MSEAIVVNLALVIRVLLVGGILLVLPRITRKGLLFGVYIGEGAAERGAAQKLLARWSVGCAVVMALSLIIGLAIGLAGWPLTGNLTGTAVLLTSAVVLYFRFHFRARELAPPTVADQAATAIAPLDPDEAKGVGLARFVLAFCVVASVVTFMYAMFKEEAATEKSYLAIMYAPSINLALSPFLALFALLTATAKRSIRGGAGGGSIEAQSSFRNTMTSVYTWCALLFCAFASFYSVEIVRYELAEIDSPGLAILIAAGVVVLFFLINLIRIMKGYGQGGARLERGAVDTPLTNGLADNARWVWGLFYVDKDDASVIVESRFGIGYTFNYGSRTAVTIVVAFLALSLSLIGLAVFKSFG